MSDRLRSRIEHIAATKAKLGPSASADVAFHLTDCRGDLEELLGFYADPDAYSDAQVYDLLIRFLVHVPNHLAAASKLFTGVPVTDVFGVGATSEPDEE
jgi:hypothetical protein